MTQPSNNIQQLQRLHPRRNESVFWSGSREVIANGTGATRSLQDDARQFATNNGKKTLDMAISDLGITPPTHSREATEFWVTASRIWAERSQGIVFAVLGFGRNVNPDSIWFQVERPILMDENRHVTQVNEYTVKFDSCVI